jgi:diguanylate cyclase (GGDEF)-like protein/putative nucleotidyltransferase with HDIG domain
MAASTAPSFGGLPPKARVYLIALPLLAAGVVAAAAALEPSLGLQPGLLALIVALCAGANLFEVFAPGHYSFQPNLVFFFWGAMLLPPWAIAVVAAACFIPGWFVHRFPWYMVSFNVTNYALSGIVAHFVGNYTSLGEATELSAAALLAAVAAFVSLNHLLLMLVITFAHRRPFVEALADGLEAIPLDAALALTGACLAALWESERALTLLAAGPMLLIYRSLWVPLLTHKSRTDPKTGLYNSEHFAKLMEASVADARARGSDLSVLMIDLDHLRVVNNNYGHLAGDLLIQGVADLLRELPGGKGVASRFGGEEFCVLLPDTSLDEALAIADSVRVRAGAARVPVEGAPGGRVGVTLSVGVAAFPDHAEDVAALMNAADAAVYDAKLGGRDRVRVALPPGVRETLDTHPESESESEPESEPETETETATAQAPMATAAALRVLPESRPALNGGRTDEPEEPPAQAPGVGRRFIPWVAAGLFGVAMLIAALASPERIQDWPLLFVGLAAAVVILDQARLDVFERANVSPACVPSIALAYFFGPLGPLVAEALIAVARVVRRDELVKWVYDFGALTLAGTAAAAVFHLLPVDAGAAVLGVGALAGLAYYAADISLLSLVLGLSQGRSPVKAWRDDLAWLWPHFIAFGILAGTLVISIDRLHGWVIAVFGIPFSMLWVAQKQYLDRSRTSVTELRRSHDELEQANERLRGLLADNRELLGRMHRSYLSTITSLARTIEAKDPYTGGHTERVADFAQMIARQLGFDATQLEAMRVGAVIHDIGKIGVPDDVLLKKGKLGEQELDTMREHPVIASYILADLELPPIVKQMARSHHERFDGSGYPDGLQGEEIPLAARILSVADALDAMISDRPYRNALPVELALEEIRMESGRQFCPKVVDALLECTRANPAWWSRDGAAA